MQKWKQKTIIKFGDTEVKKQNFCQHKRSISLKNLDIEKIVVSNKVSVGKKLSKYLIGYKDAKRIRVLCIFLQKMNAYRRDFDEIYIFLIKNNELLKKYNEI